MFKKINIFVLALVSSYISYLIYNFFLFSVVIIAVFFYLFPALAFIDTESLKPLKLQVFNWIYRQPAYTKVAKGLVIIITVYLLYSIFKLWYADVIFAEGEKASDSGNAGKAYNLLTVASDLNPGEPFYRSELAFSAAASAAALKEEDATLSAALKDEADLQMKAVLRGNPKNVSFWRTAIRTYFELTTLDKKYYDQTLKALDMAITLAPTDPKLYYNKALILDSEGKKDEEIKVLQKAIELKPNYLEATEKLNEVH